MLTTRNTTFSRIATRVSGQSKKCGSPATVLFGPGGPIFLTRSTPLFLPLIGFHRRGPTFGPRGGYVSFSLEQGRGPCPSLVSMSVVFPRYDLPTYLSIQCATRCHHFSNSSTHTNTSFTTRAAQTDRPRAGTYPCFPFYHATLPGGNISHLRSI